MHIYHSCRYCRNVYKDRDGGALDTDWNWSNAVRGQLSAAEPDTKISVACTPLRCIDLFWLFRAVCYQVPEWIIVCVHVHGHAHTHECFWRSITPLMVISERAVLLTAYWISSPMKEQRWYKKDLQVGVFVCVCVCVRLHCIRGACVSTLSCAYRSKRSLFYCSCEMAFTGSDLMSKWTVSATNWFYWPCSCFYSG